uniref:Pescadillo homolog n=1 Tax=Romanomermis culicivorax TaxID=13658 RepID=A0A915JKD8_ROMCU
CYFFQYERGAAVNYITRKAALRKLQLSLKDFRRLCILKGIHPHEPRHKKKVNKGSTEIKTWYFAKDIQFLQHEPIIQKFRDYKIFLRRLTRARSKGVKDEIVKLHDNKPKYKLDHIVKERYPTFIDAIRDLDDGLCLLFLFSRLPRSLKVTAETVHLCRRLTVEFMHYVIEARALRKAFVSIKGIYYQAEIMGQTVNWIVAHERSLCAVSAIDFGVMATFVEFYTTACKFINFKLFQELGLHYPPQLGKVQSDACENGDSEATQERLYSLNETLKRNVASTSNEIIEPLPDQFPDEMSSLSHQDEAAKISRDRQRQKRLFEKCKFFLSRETPRESLTFVIRSCGGTVSWEKTFAYGSSYDENDETITHQIIDRPSLPHKPFLSRRYVQPQWVYDCLNACMLLPVDNYLPGAVLPPHLSPFVETSANEYVPPEQIALLEKQGEDVSALTTYIKTTNSKNEIKAEIVDDVYEEKNDSVENEITDENPAEKTSTDKVSRGKIASKNNLLHKSRVETSENKKLREMMIPKKQRRVYQKILKKKKHINREAQTLIEKREKIEKRKNKKQ